MGDYDRYPENRGSGDRDRERDRIRDRDAHLDDRTGMSPGSPGGYRASFDNPREQNYNLHTDENRSFSNEDYGGGQRGGDSYYGETGRGVNRARQGQGGGGYQSHPFNPYQGGYGDRDRSLEAYRGQARSEYPYGNGRADRDGNRQGAPYAGRPGGTLAQGQGQREERTWWDRAADTFSSWFGDDDARQRHEMDMRESHRGRGPKGYRRSDDRIREDVSDRLTDDHWLDASDIEVAVSSSEVTLTGEVASRDDKRRAENLAESVSGVDHVQNNLRVRRETSSVNTDRLGGGAAGKA